MQRSQLAAGVVLLVVGLAAITLTALEFPHVTTPLSGSRLGPGQTETLPASSAVPSNATVGVLGLPRGEYLFVNYSLQAANSSASDLAAYVLNATQWSAYNATLAQGTVLPTEWIYSEAQQASGTWSLPPRSDSPFAVVYLDLSGGNGTVTESAFTSLYANGSDPRPFPLPTVLTLVSHAPVEGRVVSQLPTLGSQAYAVGESLSVSVTSTGDARLFLLSPNNTTSCPGLTFEPGALACQGAYSLLGGISGSATSLSWFAPVHGVLKGWTLVFLSTLDGPTLLKYNVTEWDLPSGTVLDTPTLVTALGASSGFFGFLAITGAFVGPTGGEAPVRRSVPSSPRPTADAISQTPPRPDVDGWRREPVVNRTALRTRSPAAGTTSSPAGPSPQARGSSASSLAGRVTCGLCGTGYSLKRGGPSCPVCGSKSVVFSSATGMELR